MRGSSDDSALSALARIFSPGVLREIATRGRSALFARLLDQALIPDLGKKATVSSAFEAAFAQLRRTGVRSEYVYRAALTHNILLGRHSLNTASMLREFRVGASKADFVLLNGTSTVYEIKSDRDSLARLHSQVADYRRVFARVYVIAGDAHMNELLATTPKDVGVMRLARWDRLQILREATNRAEAVDPTAICQSLRTSEARALLMGLGRPVPDVPNTRLHEALKSMFAILDPATVHDQMVKTLKRTRTLSRLNSLIPDLPTSLQPAALSIDLRESQRQRLLRTLRLPLKQARAWA